MMNIDINKDIMSMLGTRFIENKHNIDTNIDIVSMYNRGARTHTILAKLARFIKGTKDTMSLEIDDLLKYNSPRTFLRTLCPSEIEINAWTIAWTICPCLKN